MEESGNTELTETRSSGATHDIPLLSDSDLANWQLVAVGGAHVVFRYLGVSPELRLTVLKLRKQHLTTGWTLRLGLALVLRELRGAETAARGRGGDGREQMTSKLYSLIPAKYLPLQKVVRIPQSIADRFLLRAACESTHVEASGGHSHPAHVIQAESRCARCRSPRLASSSPATDRWQPQGGVSLQGNCSGSTYPEDAYHSWIQNESYVLCLLEEDLLTTPVRASATTVVNSQAAGGRGSVEASSGLAHIALSTPKIANSLSEMYYAIELKPKCGLLEPLDDQEPVESTEPPEDQPAPIGFEGVSQGTCFHMCGSLNLTSEKQPAEVCTTTASQQSPPPRMSGACGIPHSLRDPPRFLHDAVATEPAAAEGRIEQAKQFVNYCRANRFKMQQYLKLRRGHISRPSLYDPVQFFKCTPCTIRDQLLNLMENPQNNLVTFLNGARIHNFGNASKVNFVADSLSNNGIVERTKCARTDNFLRLLLERIWEREKSVFSGILVLQAFAAGQQHLSLQLVRELRRVFGKTYGELAEEHFLRSVDLYTEAASRGTVLLRATSALSEARSSVCLATCHSPADILRTTPGWMAALYITEGLAILSSLKALNEEKGDGIRAESNDVSSVVKAAFQWLRQYLLGRTFMDVSVITNILILDGGSPLATGVQGTDDVAVLTSRFERLELDEELTASAALLLADQLAVTASVPKEAARFSEDKQMASPRLPPAVFFRVTTTDMDFKPESRIEEWSTKWTEIQRAYFQMHPEGLKERRRVHSGLEHARSQP